MHMTRNGTRNGARNSRLTRLRSVDYQLQQYYSTKKKKYSLLLERH